MKFEIVPKDYKTKQKEQKPEKVQSIRKFIKKSLKVHDDTTRLDVIRKRKYQEQRNNLDERPSRETAILRHQDEIN